MFLENCKKAGSIEVICGSMFSGKTEELIRRMKRAVFANQNVAIYKPAIDVRYSESDVVSHDSHKIASTPISDPKEMLAALKAGLTQRHVGEDDGVGVPAAPGYHGAVGAALINGECVTHGSELFSVGRQLLRGNAQRFEQNDVHGDTSLVCIRRRSGFFYCIKPQPGACVKELFRAGREMDCSGRKKLIYCRKDGFAGTLVDTYANIAALATDNLVFLPVTGYRDGSDVYSVGTNGYYWSSSANRDEALSMRFNSKNLYLSISDGRYCGYAVRLITECQ